MSQVMQPLEASGAAALAARPAGRFSAGRWSDYLELAKPEVTSLIVVTTAIGFVLGSPGPVPFLLLLHTLVGTLLVAAGTGALNQFWERHTDALMRRTARRPIPSGRLSAAPALAFGAGCVVGGTAYLALAANILAAGLAFATFVTYLFVYTPLKRRTTACTTVGAFPGAVPPLIGWAAASGSLGPGAWILYAVLFLWQFPHFMAIAWMYREDYGRAGIVMLPVVEPDGLRTSRQILAASAILIPVSVLPYVAGLAGGWYVVGAIVLGAAFLYFGVRLVRLRTVAAARRLLLASVIYLPLLGAVLLLDKR